MEVEATVNVKSASASRAGPAKLATARFIPENWMIHDHFAGKYRALSGRGRSIWRCL